MGILDGEPLWSQHQDISPSLHAICRVEAGSPRSPAAADPSCSTRQPAHDFIRCQRISQVGWPKPRDDCGKGQDPTTAPRFSPFAGYGGRRLGVGTRDIHPGDYEPGSQHGGHAAENAESGKCLDPSDPAHRGEHSASPSDSTEPCRGGVRCGESSFGMTEDWDTDTITFMQHEQLHLKQLIQQYERELESHLTHVQPMGPPCHLLEVFCSQQSPLTHQMQQLGRSAYRFGRSEGDLETVSGRAKLFSAMARHRPKHIWVSPDCGPWSSWSNLNASRSLEAHDAYQNTRKKLLYQIALCIVLFRHQIMQGQQFHWEQPARSLMLSHPGLAEVHAYTRACQFDMCRVGDLRCPLNGMLMKKGMVVLTTDDKIYFHLHGRVCDRSHQHQPIEGNTITKEGPMLRTEFTAVYPRKFARSIAKIMCLNQPMSRSTDMNPVYAADSRRPRPKLTFARSELITPEPRDENLSKRRRLEGKQRVIPDVDILQGIINSVEQILPRVGRYEIQNQAILNQLQEIFSDKQIMRVIACRGTDRTLGPPERMNPQEAPFCRSLLLMRTTNEIKYERFWEQWDRLSKRQLIRPAHSCRINITMFAKNPEAPEDLEVRASGSMSSADRSVAVPSMLPPPLETNANSSSRNSADALMERRNPSELESQPEVPKPADETPTKHQDSRFKALPKWEQQEITNMHKNLGHPSNDRLSKALQVAGYRVEVVQAALELKCHICAACSPPKHQRPGTLKPLLDFNHKVYIDGVNWKNSKGKSFHWYHFLDAGSNYHVAVCAPSRDTQDFARLIDHHWISWAGPPNMIQVDSATEMNSHDLTSFMQRYGIKQLTIPPEAHWQQGKIERHGGFLQSMLTKLDLEHAIDDYTQLQTALNQCTHAKNSLSIRHGYAPEVIVFGKHSRLARSILSDESRPSHELALREDQDIGVQEFKSLLQIRESARRAFHSVDNSNALRRAVLRRPCPPRGMYEPNQWVMIWRAEQQGNPKWIGPQKIIIQDGNHTVWSTQGGKLFRSAPEHVRLALPEEGTDESSELPEDHTMLHRQIERINQESHNQLPTIPEMHELDFPPSNPSQALQVPTQPESETSGVSRTNSESIPQPDHEPESSRQVTPMPPLAISEEHLQENDQLICEDVDWVFQTDAVDIDAAWRCEFDVSLQSHEALPQNQAEAWTLLATSAKKQRTEVKQSELSPAEKAEFDRAKEAEVQNWIQTGTLSKVLRNQIPDDQILRCRWILTWKPLDPVGETQDNPNVSQKSPCQSQRTHKAKARLVVLGYLDPKIEEIPRDSPTLHRTSRMLLLQTIASNGWSLESFDIRAAFLQGTPQSDRVIGIEPVSEIRKAMNMSPWEVGKLNKGAYGLIDAPYLWYCALVTELQKLGFVATPFDPCLFVLRMPAGESNAGALAGVLGVHVDDGIGGGNEFYQEKIKLLEKKFPFGSHKTQAFTFTGIEVNQRGDNSIHLSQSSYVRKIKPIAIDINRKSQTNSPVTENEKLALRGLIGSLQYASTNTRPDLASKLSFLQSAINNATVDTLLERNRLLHEAKHHHDVAIVIKPISTRDFRFMAFSDASFSSSKKPDSHSGVIIVGTHKDINDNKQCPISPISWGCKKIQRVVTSTLAAESSSLASALDQLAWLRIFWSWLHDPKVEWRKPQQTLKQLAPAISAPTFKQTADLAITDCKSLYDLTTRTAPPSCTEFRVQLVSRAIKEALQENIRLRWVHSGAQLADALTKAMESHFLRETLRMGTYRLVDEASTLKERAKTKDRVRWLKEQNEINKKEILGM